MRFYVLFLIISICIFCVDTSQSIEVIKCLFPSDNKGNEDHNSMNVISTFVGQSFRTEKGSYNYVVSICSDASKDHELGTVIRKNSEGIVVLGRRNDTRIIHGNNWMILVFGSGDYILEKKDFLQRRMASVYFVCNPDGNDDKAQVQLVQDDGGNYIFTLPTHSVCEFNEEMSGTKIFLMIVTISFSVYCLIGIAYRRFVHNAHHWQLIPHSMFWSKIGNKLADGCDYICRCYPEHEDSWNNIMTNFEAGYPNEALLP